MLIHIDTEPQGIFPFKLDTFGRVRKSTTSRGIDGTQRVFICEVSGAIV